MKIYNCRIQNNRYKWKRTIHALYKCSGLDVLDSFLVSKSFQSQSFITVLGEKGDHSSFFFSILLLRGCQACDWVEIQSDLMSMSMENWLAFSSSSEATDPVGFLIRGWLALQEKQNSLDHSTRRDNRKKLNNQTHHLELIKTCRPLEHISSSLNLLVNLI